MEQPIPLTKAFGKELSQKLSNIPVLENNNVYAFLGDAVYEVMVRMYQIAHNPNDSVKKMGDMSRQKVMATFQAKLIHFLDEFATEEEKEYIKIARNQCKIRKGGNFSPIEYRLSTALEAIIGRLFIREPDRFGEWMEKIGEYFNEQNSLRS